MLDNSDLVAFIQTTDLGRARIFYVDKLGLCITSQDDFAVNLKANGTRLRITKVATLSLNLGTVLGWNVKNINTTMQQLIKVGIEFEFFEGMGQNESGICTFPEGSMVAWFKDPDGNLLSLTQQAHGNNSSLQ